MLDELAFKCEERKWPIGLANIDKREINRHEFEKYKCRKLIGECIILILSHENLHLNSDLIDSNVGFSMFVRKDAFM